MTSDLRVLPLLVSLLLLAAAALSCGGGEKSPEGEDSGARDAIEDAAAVGDEGEDAVVDPGFSMDGGGVVIQPDTSKPVDKDPGTVSPDVGEDGGARDAVGEDAGDVSEPVGDIRVCVLTDEGAPEACAEEGALDFGAVTAGAGALKTLRLDNEGEGDEILAGAAVDSEHFQVVVFGGEPVDIREAVELPATLAPGGSLWVDVELLSSAPVGALPADKLVLVFDRGEPTPAEVEVLLLGSVAECGAGFGGVLCEECLPGFFGPDCEPCPGVGEVCSGAGVCDDGTDGGGECECSRRFAGEDCSSCAEGFEGDDCSTDVDECEPEPCRNGGVCRDLVGAFECDCPAAWTGATCSEDVDECARGSDICHDRAACTNTEGGHEC